MPIEAHRWRMGRHHIDLIVRRTGIVAFIEVRSLSGAKYGAAVGAPSKRKQATFGRVAALWALRFGRKDDAYRFDVIGVHIHPNERIEIEHTEDAWRL